MTSKSVNHWYPRYPADYGKKTRHLSLLEHGAYSLMMDYCYSTGNPLPANAVQLHRICSAFEEAEQQACMKVLREFFVERDDGWHNDRIDEELLKRSSISEKRSKAAQKRHANAGASAYANAGANGDTSTATANIYKTDDDDMRAKSFSGEIIDVPTDREMILSAIGVDPVSGMIGPTGKMIGTPSDMIHAKRWMDMPGMGLSQVCDVLREVMAKKNDGPPYSFKYFDSAMQSRSGELTMPQLEPIKPTGGRNGKLTDREQFDITHAEYARRLSAGQIDRGPDPSDPWA